MLKQYLIDGFSQGFDLGCISCPKSRSCDNHPSTRKHLEHVQQKLQHEIQLGCIQGPFEKPPFPDLVCSPLGVVPKSSPGKFRLIHDLSFPFQDSVNSHIPDESAKVQYDTIQSVLELVKRFGKGCLMAKTDIEDAFRIIPLHPNCYKLLGICWEGVFYYDRCLPMGAKSSCRIFETFSCALQWVMCKIFQARGMSHMIEDFFFYW